jgi:hypothetical protein
MICRWLPLIVTLSISGGILYVGFFLQPDIRMLVYSVVFG